MPTNVNKTIVFYKRKISMLKMCFIPFYCIRFNDFNTTIMSHQNYGLISIDTGYFGKSFGKTNDDDSILVNWRNRSSAFIGLFRFSVEK